MGQVKQGPDDKEANGLLLPAVKRAMMSPKATVPIDTVLVSRSDLEQEHRLLIARLHLLRRQLGYAPLTDKEQRRQATK